MEHHNRDQLVTRLKTVEGHIRGIQRMLEDDTYCIDIIHQIHAVQSALNKLNLQILDEHLNSCVISAIRDDDPGRREQVLKEITDVYEAATKV